MSGTGADDGSSPVASRSPPPVQEVARAPECPETTEARRQLRPFNQPHKAFAGVFGGSEDAAAAALDGMHALLDRVACSEPKGLLRRLTHIFAQHLAFLLSTHPGAVEHVAVFQRFVSSLEESLDLRSIWPTGPVADLRAGTLLQEAPQVIFQLSDQGPIRLQWANPLPKPELGDVFGIQCDLCKAQTIQAAYQHVDDDNFRDTSSFIKNRLGFDACAPCMASHISAQREQFHSWLNGAADIDGEAQTFIREGAVVADMPMDLQLSVRSFAAPPVAAGGDGGCGGAIVVLSLDVRGTAGLHVAAAALPDVDSGPPSAWAGTGTNTASATQAHPSREPTPQPLEDAEVAFKCAAGRIIHIAPGKRGTLVYSIHSAPSNASSEKVVSCRSLCYTEREVTHDSGNLLSCKVGDKVPHVSFQGTGEGAWLTPGDAAESCSALAKVASRAGVAHNIPRQSTATCESTQPGPLPPAASSERSPAQNADAVTAYGFLRSTDWEALDNCMICQDALGGTAAFRGPPLRTRCGHCFHSSCLRKHLRGHASKAAEVCPGCRAEDPLTGACMLCEAAELHLSLERDALGDAFRAGRSYRVVAVLCQDLEAILDSALVAVRAGWIPEADPDNMELPPVQ